MKKQPQIEDALKTMIRDELALRPMSSVQAIRIALMQRGFHNIHNRPPDWHYVAKLMRKVRGENLIKLGAEDRSARIVAFKERQRIITDNLIKILEGDPHGTKFPTHLERIAAANSILKWDLAALFADAQAEGISRRTKSSPKAIIVLGSSGHSSGEPIISQSKSVIRFEKASMNLPN